MSDRPAVATLRSDGERKAYLEGMRAGIELVETSMPIAGDRAPGAAREVVEIIERSLPTERPK